MMSVEALVVINAAQGSPRPPAAWVTLSLLCSRVVLLVRAGAGVVGW